MVALFINAAFSSSELNPNDSTSETIHQGLDPGCLKPWVSLTSTTVNKQTRKQHMNLGKHCRVGYFYT